MAAILNSAILNSIILDSGILVCPLKLTHTCQDWVPPFAQKNVTHSFWLHLMMAAILNSATMDATTTILDSDTLLSYLRFTQKHSPSTLTLTQTNSIWFKLICSHSTWIIAAILNCTILDSASAICGIRPSWFSSSQTHSKTLSLQIWFPPFALIQTDSNSFILT